MAYENRAKIDYIEKIKGIGGPTGEAIMFSSQFSDASGDSDLLNAYQAVPVGTIIVHQGAFYKKTTYGLETIGGHCLINGSFENTDSNGDLEFWFEGP